MLVSSLFVLAVLSKPYAGIRHDSVLYLGQALYEIYPERLAHDIFFQYGSQSSFTLFPTFIGKLIEIFPVADVFLYTTLLSRLAFAWASWYLLRDLVPANVRIIATAAAITLPSFYGGSQLLSYAEPFLTARAIAEPIALVGLAFILQQKYLLSGIILAIGGLMHPLQIIPIIAIGLPLAVNDKKKAAIVIAVLLATASFVTLSSKAVQSNVTTVVDVEWNRWLHAASDHLFISSWSIEDWSFFCTDFFLVALFSFHTKGTPRKLSHITLCVSLAAVLFSALLFDLLHFSLAGALQAWRTQWLLHWLAVSTLPATFYVLYKQKNSAIQILLVASIATTGMALGWNPLAVGGVPIIFIALYILNARATFSPLFKCAIAVFCVLSNALIVCCLFDYLYTSYKNTGSTKQNLLAFVICLFASATVLRFIRIPSPKLAAVIFCNIYLAGAVLAVGLWDMRSIRQRQSERNFPISTLEGSEIDKLPNDTQILWPNHVLQTWLWFHRPSYMSPSQLAGIIFNRETARQADLRTEKLVTEDQSGLCLAIASKGQKRDLPQCKFTYSIVEQICRNTTPLPLVILLDEPIDFPVNRRELRSLATQTIGSERFKLYMYQCAKLNL